MRRRARSGRLSAYSSARRIPPRHAAPAAQSLAFAKLPSASHVIIIFMENRDYDPKADGFVYSREQIRSIIEREQRLQDAKHYEKAGWSRQNRPPSRSPRPPKAA